MAQFATWEAVLGVFIFLSIIQFVVGSYVEPLVSGKNVGDLADGCAVRGLFLELPLGPVRDLHRRADRDRHSDVLQALSDNPMDR